MKNYRRNRKSLPGGRRGDEGGGEKEKKRKLQQEGGGGIKEERRASCGGSDVGRYPCQDTTVVVVGNGRLEESASSSGKK